MKKILIFDGHPSIRRLLAEEFAAEGQVTMSVSKAEFVKESVERFDPDLIILDLFSRGEILWDLLGELKNRYPAIPILPFRAFHPKEFPRLRHADGWAQKSFLFKELKEEIAVFLEEKKEEFPAKEPILTGDPNHTRFRDPFRTSASMHGH